MNVPSAQHIAVVDRNKGSVLATWSLDDKKANFPMALDEPDHRVFVATRQPAALLVHDTNTAKRVADLSIGGDADDLFFDAERKRIYVICGQGVIDVVQQRDADRYQSVAQVLSAPGARTGPLRGCTQDSVRRGSGAWTFTCRDPRLRGQVGRVMEQTKKTARGLQS